MPGGFYMDYFVNYIIPFSIAFVSAYIAAFAVSFAIDSLNRSKQIKIAKANIETELQFICNNMLYPYGTDEITDEEIFFDTPIWNTVVSNGYVLTIRKHEAFFRAALASYRQLELLKEEEKRIIWDKLSTAERIDIINERRKTREIVRYNLKVIEDCLKDKIKPSKEHDEMIENDKKTLEELKKSFRKAESDKISIGDGENEFLFNGRNIKEKGIFFQTESLINTFDNVPGYEAKYGIGFGEYDCEIYLHVWEDADDKDNCDNIQVAGIKEKLRKLVAMGEKDKNIIHTFYKQKFGDTLRIGNNYSRLVLASKSLEAEEYTGKYTKARIEEATIHKMIKDLLEFEKEWLVG
jgi:glycosyltransferase involved in cell wall biosynthesis